MNLAHLATLKLAIAILLSACAAIPEIQPQPPGSATEMIADSDPKGDPEDNSEETAPESPQSAEQSTKAFPEETLYQLLVADISLIRGQFEPALEKYLQQARETRDMAVITMANRVALHQRDTDALLETALLWIEQMPDQAEAHQAALQAYALQGKPLKALSHAHWLYVYEDDIEAFLAVTAIDEGSKQALIPSLIEAYQNLSLDKDKQPMVKLAQAILFLESGQAATAIETAEQFLESAPSNQRGLLFLAQTLQQQNRMPEALNLLEAALLETPQNRTLRLQYARLLTLTDRAQAIVQFEMLRQKDADNQQVNYLLALLYLNQGTVDPAVELFVEASSDPSIYADAHYHLGSIAERKGFNSSALQHYQQVRSGRNYLAAASRSALLLTQQQGISSARSYLQNLRTEQPSQSPALFQMESNLLISTDRTDQAFNILTHGLQEHPDNPQLLYARSMVSEMQNNYQLVERDLRAILAQDPDNSAALNALGYTMVLHTDRLEEAHRLIKRAYLLNPGEPAILDSMGWVLFVLGHPRQALPYLEKAMGIMEDPEIAAHLGEVLWVLGDRPAAMETWNRGLEQAPDDKNINEAIKRLAGPLKADPTKDSIKDPMKSIDTEAFGIESTPTPIDKPSAE